MSLHQMMLNEIIGKPVLYHFTRLDNLFKIVESNELKPFLEGKVFFTRNYNANIRGRSRLYVRMTIDRQKLVDYYKVNPSLFSPTSLHNKSDDGNIRRTHFHKLDTKIQNRIKTVRKEFGDEREENVQKNIEDLHKFVIQIDILFSKGGESWVEQRFSMNRDEIINHFNNKTDMFVTDNNDEFLEELKETYPSFNHYQPSDLYFRIDLARSHRNKFNKMIKSPNYNYYKGKFNIVNEWRPVKV